MLTDDNISKKQSKVLTVNQDNQTDEIIHQQQPEIHEEQHMVSSDIIQQQNDEQPQQEDKQENKLQQTGFQQLLQSSLQPNQLQSPQQYKKSHSVNNGISTDNRITQFQSQYRRNQHLKEHTIFQNQNNQQFQQNQNEKSNYINGNNSINSESDEQEKQIERSAKYPLSTSKLVMNQTLSDKIKGTLIFVQKGKRDQNTVKLNQETQSENELFPKPKKFRQQNIIQENEQSIKQSEHQPITFTFDTQQKVVQNQNSNLKQILLKVTQKSREQAQNLYKTNQQRKNDVNQQLNQQHRPYQNSQLFNTKQNVNLFNSQKQIQQDEVLQQLTDQYIKTFLIGLKMIQREQISVKQLIKQYQDAKRLVYADQFVQVNSSQLNSFYELFFYKSRIKDDIYKLLQWLKQTNQTYYIQFEQLLQQYANIQNSIDEVKVLNQNFKDLQDEAEQFKLQIQQLQEEVLGLQEQREILKKENDVLRTDLMAERQLNNQIIYKYEEILQTLNTIEDHVDDQDLSVSCISSLLDDIQMLIKQ